MTQEMGESREAWGSDVMKMAEAFANMLKTRKEPFYIVYACKPDAARHGVFRQTMRAYAEKPSAMLGILVWYVNHGLGEFHFCPELSAPPDVPLDPSILSTQTSDMSDRVAGQGEKLNVLIS